MIYYENNNGTRMDLDNWPVVIEDITDYMGKSGNIPQRKM